MFILGAEPDLGNLSEFRGPPYNSEKNVKRNTLFPVNNLYQKSESDGIVCSVFHHPYIWFETDNVKEFKRFIELNSNLIFTGHEHELDQISQYKFSGPHNEFLNGGELQGSDKNESKFQIQTIDLDSNLTQCFQFGWAGSNYTTIKKSELVPSLQLKATDSIDYDRTNVNDR
ncbi:hypothetical protein ACFLW6_04800 [Chloroflexota bacterium]